MFLLNKLFGTSQERKLKKFKQIVIQIHEWEERFKDFNIEALQAKTAEFKQRYHQGTSLDELLPEAYAVVKCGCRRLCGTQVHVSGYDQRWDMIPYDVQLLGAIAMHQGHIAEMQTGEGKTLTAVLPLYLNALTGKPVHLITVNDYLAHRDASWVGPLLKLLGITTSVITNDTPSDIRKELYKADVVYGTASEFGFDYLRDHSMAMSEEEQVQRGFYFAMIDEIDSILIDEARTPLIISGPVPESTQLYEVLKTAVAAVVKLQKEICHKIALEAKGVIESYLEDETLPLNKDKVKKACRLLWIVDKGMPYNKLLKRAKEHPDLRAEIDKWDLFYHLDQNKAEKAKELAQLMIIVDEKGHDFELTDLGIATWAELEEGLATDFVMLDLAEEYSKIDASELSDEEKLEAKLKINVEDALRKERAHNIRQLLRAHLMMERDVDYIIQEGKVIIIDENTGRPQPGRRFSDGLHQAIEAKENVRIQKESQTYATITLQNYFRMYEKLAGMTGTAITEAHEFKEIYKLEVLQIPTHRPCVRLDYNDEIYMTEREKYQAIIKEIEAIHTQGRPLLIGTESVEASEKLSRILRQRKINHTMLNAKHHAQEAHIIADAGQKSAVTVATNMAGRGTDIKLSEEVKQLGGLHVIGTTRHQSRRIDRQLKGRCARLGDPGSSKFFISFEDQLMRLFSSPRLTAMLQRFRPPEGEAISANMLNRSIETAQKRVEGRHYTMRKHTLEYDNVMNKHRQEVYKFRDSVIKHTNIIMLAEELLKDTAYYLLQSYGADMHRLEQEVTACFPIHVEAISKDSLADELVHTFQQKLQHEQDKLKNHALDATLFVQQALKRTIIMQIDHLWQEHLLEMDHLRNEVNLRAVAQKDPLMEFKQESFSLFHKLSQDLYLEASKSLFKIYFDTQAPVQPQIHGDTGSVLLSNLDLFAMPKTVTTLCPCQSGLPFEECCGQGIRE